MPRTCGMERSRRGSPIRRDACGRFPRLIRRGCARRSGGSTAPNDSRPWRPSTQPLRRARPLVVNPARNYGDMPLIVLTATDRPPPPGVAPDLLAQFIEMINLGHDELAALSTRGVNARVPGATHSIQDVRPQVVIDAIVAVVAQARAGAAGD